MPQTFNIISQFAAGERAAAQKAFLAELESQTIQCPDMTGGRKRLWNGCVVLEIFAMPGGSMLMYNIQALNPMNGHGSKALDWVMSLADRHGLVLSLTVAPPTRKNPANPLHEKSNLQAWYERRGFVQRTHISLRRMPKPAVS